MTTPKSYQLTNLPTYQLTNLPTYQFHPVIMFDGVCNLCNAFVRFVIRRDPRARYRFASLQSSAAAALLDGRRPPGPTPDSVVLLENGRLFTESNAALRVAKGLTFPWNLAYALVVIPRPLRD